MLFRVLLAALAAHSLATAQLARFQDRAQKGVTSGLNLRYRLFVPADYDKAKKYPVVLALHGAGECGHDNAIQITANRLATIWIEDSLQSRVPHFVVAPQCPLESTWVKYNQPLAGRPLSGTLKIVLEIVDSLGREFNLDADRQYCVGLSMGGYATWELAQRFPTRFAAIVPICGWADTTQAAPLKNIPIWAFHGASDPTVNVAGSRNIIAAIRHSGGTPKYTEYPGVGHESWVPALKEKELSPWLFSRQRPGAVALRAPVLPAAAPAPQALHWRNADYAADGRLIPTASAGGNPQREGRSADIIPPGR